MNDATKELSVQIRLNLTEQVSTDEVSLIERYLGDILAQVVLGQDNENEE